MKTIVFACVHNAGRSQMAAALFNHRADPRKARALSAGTQPSDRVHPEVVAVMQELGVDVSDARPQLLSREVAEQASLLVTMGCDDQCPFVPGLTREDWPLDDPKGKTLAQVRSIRDDISNRVDALLDRERLR